MERHERDGGDAEDAQRGDAGESQQDRFGSRPQAEIALQAGHQAHAEEQQRLPAHAVPRDVDRGAPRAVRDREELPVDGRAQASQDEQRLHRARLRGRDPGGERAIEAGLEREPGQQLA
jgi:hypothetical protein